jgi:biotin transport system substrate-specific component
MKARALSYENRVADAAIGVAFFALATLFGSFVRIPVPGTPVPLTLQTFFALLSGAVLGRRLGALSQLSFIALWSGLGISHIWGPTGGYIIGLAAASYIVGWLTEGRPFGAVRAALAFILGNIVIYAFGIAQLVFFYRIAPDKAFLMGALPFIAGDLAKIIIATAIYAGISTRPKYAS